MPTYQYECRSCSHQFDILQKMTDERLKKCPQCGQDALERLIGAGAGIIFKGSGFYETDYKKKSSSASLKDASAKESSPQDVSPCPKKDSCGCCPHAKH